MSVQSHLAGAAAPKATTDSPASSTPKPASGQRLIALDFTRGLALLGITLVNVYMFALPFGTFMTQADGYRDGVLNEFAYWVMHTMCAGRFYPLFSLMFGIGMMMILTGFIKRQSSAGSPADSVSETDLRERMHMPTGFGWAFVRRLVVLAAIGVCHFTFIWYGDIVFFYACVGLILLLTPMFSARTLLLIAGIAYVVSLLLLGGMLALQFVFDSAPGAEVATAALPDSLSKLPPAQRLIEALSSGKMQGGPEHPAWQAIEMEVFTQGPWSQAVIYRLIMYAIGFAFMTFGMLGTVITMFLTGAAMVRINFFSAKFRTWHWRLAIAGYGGGFVVSQLSMILDQIIGWDHEWLSMLAQILAGPWMAIGLLCICLLAVPAVIERGGPALRAVVRGVANMGRMGLTNYITMSILATFITNWWGLGLYGTLSLFEMMLMAIGLWMVLLITSNIWLKFFALGPLEWIWKSATYWKLGGHTPRA